MNDAEAVLINHRSVTDAPADPNDDPLLAACRLIGGALGITIRPPITSGNSAVQRDPLVQIGRASRIRTRQVLLKGEWWRRDNGPLLAYRETDRQPVALLPRGRRYDLIDPVTSSRTQVTADVADGLSSFAVMLYRPLPERALSVWDALRFGLWGSRRDLGTLLLLGLAQGMFSLALPLAIAWIFGSLVPTGQRAEILLLGLALFVGVWVVASFQMMLRVAELRFQTRSGAALDAAIWDRLLSLPASFFRSYTADDLRDRALAVGHVWQTLGRRFVAAMLAAIAACFSLLLLLFFDTRLALIALGVVVVLTILAGLLSLLQLRRERALSAAQGRASGLVFQFVGGITKFRVAGAEQRAFAQWTTAFQAQRRATTRIGLIESTLGAWNTLTPLLAVIALLIATSLSRESRLSFGPFLAFLVAFVQLMLCALTISRAVATGLRVAPLLQRALPILRVHPEVDQARADPGQLSGAIDLNRVSFRYAEDGPLILNDVSLHVDPGEFVALVGPSGSGKSTLLRLLLGFETCRDGAILYDGHDLQTLDMHEVRRQLGVVLQNGTLMADDIFHNIIGSSLLTVEDAWEAARMVGLDDEIRQLPMGMHTMVPEGGSTFSGGQRQRILIARALVHQPRILFFDEATSALDNVTQSIVSGSLEQLRVTRVVIAHRLSTIAHADRIYVLDRGRIVESGTYDQLMQQDGLFADLARRQIA